MTYNAPNYTLKQLNDVYDLKFLYNFYIKTNVDIDTVLFKINV